MYAKYEVADATREIRERNAAVDDAFGGKVRR